MDITELETLDPDRVDAVGSAANGAPFLMLKALGEANCETCEGSGKIKDGHVECPTCGGSGKAAKSDSSESDAIEEEVTDEAAKALAVGFCGDEACQACKERFGPMHEELVSKAKLKAKARRALPDSDFALPEKREFPIHDENHARAALSMLHNASPAEQKKIRAAVRRRYPNIAQAKKSPGVPDFATATPVEHGEFTDTGTSGGGGLMTTGVEHPHEDPSYALGGQSPYVIPDEKTAYAPDPNAPAPGRENRPGGAEASPTAKMTANVITSLVEAIDLLSTQRAAKADTKTDRKHLALPNPKGTAASKPSSGPWEDYDSASLEQVAQMLASCARALDAIEKREATEAVNGNQGDYKDTSDLQMAGEALDAALSVVARLAFHEGAAGSLEKSGRVLSAKNEEHLRAARDHLSHVLAGVAEPNQAGNDASDPSEENEIMTTVTKEDLADLIAKSAAAAAKAEREAERKAAIKAAKKAAKRAKKNANNGGDITGAQERDEMKGDIDAQLNGVPDGGHVNPEFINKSEQKLLKAMAAQLKASTETLGRVEERVTKMAQRPRPGGPVLDGQPRGTFPATESRLMGTLTKGQEDAELEALAKQIEATNDPAKLSDLEQRRTLLRLVKAHESGQI